MTEDKKAAPPPPPPPPIRYINEDKKDKPRGDEK